MNKPTKIACVLAAFFANCAYAANQQTDDTEVIVVTAERLPVLEKETARFVVVASGEELIESGANNLIDGLRRMGGMSYKSLAPLGISRGGMNSTVSIRGLEDGEVILVNGVPIQSAAGGSYDLSAFSLDNVERVEVLTGAASTLYGADAMTGVINIITKDADSVQSKVSVQTGNEGFRNVSASMTAGRFQFGISYQHIDAVDKIYEKFSKKKPYITGMDDTDRYDFFLNGKLTDNLSINYTGGVVETGWDKLYLSTNASEHDDQHQIRHYLSGRYQKDAIKLTSFISWDKRSSTQTKPEPEPTDTRYNYNFGLTGDYHFTLGDAELTVGSELIRRIADYSDNYGRKERDDLAVFGQYKRSFGEKMILTVGAREQFVEGKDGAEDYSRFLPSAGVNYAASSTLNLFANVGKAFRAPTFNNLYYKSRRIAGAATLGKDLNPEEGWSYEAGAKYDNDWLSVRLAAFVLKYEDKIQTYDYNDDLISYYNAGNYENQGVEWKIDMTPFHASNGILSRFGLTMSGFAADPVADDEDGVEEQNGPKLQTKFGINYLGDNLTANLDIQNTSDREDELPSQLLVNFYSSYDLAYGSLTLAVDNLLDDENITGGSTSSRYSSRYYGLERIAKLGYQVSF